MSNTVLLGATGAVGSHVARTCVRMPDVSQLTLMGRRGLDDLVDAKVVQAEIDISRADSYAHLLPGHHSAICTLGVGEPSKIGRDEFVRVDKLAVLEFAGACREAGVRHFQLLGSVGSSSRSRSFYLRTKGELEDGLRDLGFRRLSLFRPSMILTPTNRYGLSQAVALAVWPKLNPLLRGGLERFRGVRVERLGRAMALNIRGNGSGVEVLHWDRIEALADGDVTG